MKRVLAGAVALAAVGVGITPATAQKPPKTSKQLSISAHPSIVKSGTTVAVTGKLTGPKVGGEAISLREDPFPFGDPVPAVAPAAVDAQGDYSFARVPSVNTRYQTTQGGAESEIVAVLVRPGVSIRLSDRTPAARSAVRFSGRVCPEHDGASLSVQRRIAPDRWRTIRSTRLADAPATSCSTYSRRILIVRDGLWRTVLRAHADHAAGVSASRRIDVH